MRIESLTRSPQTGRFTLVFADGHKMRVEASVVADCGLFGGRELTDEEYEALLAAAKKASSRARAVRIVAASNVSERELRRRLLQKGETAQDADEAVSWLGELGVLDDEKAARDIARRAAAKGYGAARIRQELYAKGIPRELWDEALKDLPEPDDAIDRFLAQRLRGQMLDEREKRRVTDALCRRGHSYGDIRAALRRYEESLEE